VVVGLSDTRLGRFWDSLANCQYTPSEFLAVQAFDDALHIGSGLKLNKTESSRVARDAVSNDLHGIHSQTLLLKPGLKIRIVARVRDIANKQSRH
jgi:hypothetical protein